MEKKKRVVFLSRYVGIVNRGVETYVLELSKRLKKDFEVEILSGADADDFSKIIKGKFDIVIPTNGRLQSLKASAGRFLSQTHYKTIISGQAGVGRDDIWNIFVTFPNAYVALTDYEKDFAKKWSWKTKVVKIPNGVDLNKFKPIGPKIELNLPRPVILSVGALEWYKHHELTIKAIARLEKGSLIIVGNGSKKEELMSIGKKLLGDRFKISELSFVEMPEIYRSADVFTLPSWIRESFGIVYVEAMASGLPVVAPDDIPRREIIGKAGIFIDVFNAEKFAEALKKAVQYSWDGLPRKQAEKFDWDKIAEEYIKLINSL